MSNTGETYDLKELEILEQHYQGYLHDLMPVPVEGLLHCGHENLLRVRIQRCIDSECNPGDIMPVIFLGVAGLWYGWESSAKPPFDTACERLHLYSTVPNHKNSPFRKSSTSASISLPFEGISLVKSVFICLVVLSATTKSCYYQRIASEYRRFNVAEAT